MAGQALSVAFVVPRYVSYGGGERFLERAITALQMRGVKVAIIAREWKPMEGVTVIPCDVLSCGEAVAGLGVSSEGLQDRSRAQFRLGPSARSHRVRRRVPRRRRRAPGIPRTIGSWVVPCPARLRETRSRTIGIMLAAERKLYSSSRLRMVICNSEMVRDEIRRHYGVSDQRLSVIRNGVNGEEFHPRLRQEREAVRDQLGIPRQAFVFLFVGSGFKRKGLAQALAAVGRLRDPAWLVVVGRDRRERHYRQLALELGIADRVRFLGAQQHVAQYYGAADAFVLPSLYDPASNAVLEALASGLPVITSTKCGTAELIEPGVNGFVCDALDVASLERCMQALTAASPGAILGGGPTRSAALYLRRDGASVPGALRASVGRTPEVLRGERSP